MRVNRRTTGQSAQKLVSGTVEMMSVGIEIEVSDHRSDDLGYVLAGEQRRYATKGEPCWSERVHVEARPLPFGATLEDGVNLMPLELHHDRLE